VTGDAEAEADALNDDDLGQEHIHRFQVLGGSDDADGDEAK
jgi:hypothetical protein